ncbi:MAG: glucose-6-phosphate dehydrogenase [Clostridia bacterium]|nr:glucose-6-phosphate dehydrogenase [Clostridia bacterium]
MGSRIPDCCLIIFGATGDLARRKLFPALASLAAQKLLPNRFAVVGLARRPETNSSFRNYLKATIQQYAPRQLPSGAIEEFLLPRTHYIQADIHDPDSYARLQAILVGLEDGGNTTRNHIFYLALAPEHFQTVAQNLQRSGLVPGQPYTQSWPRLVIEKPFGWDLESARRLNQALRNVFPEEAIYRIDHYLGKEMIQNLMVIRFANAFFEPVWNNKYIDHVQISSLETDGVGTRATYYEKAGALRDMVQNHMLQLVSMIAMEPPANLDTNDIREEKVKVLRSLQPFTPQTIRKNAVRGQYQGYRSETGVRSNSTTETFVALKLAIDNFRWARVPFYLRTGKQLAQKAIEIVVQFKSLPEILYFKEYGELLPNLLAIRIQPLEGVFLRLNAKRPGTNDFIIPIKLDFCQNCEVGTNSPEAYERLLLDAMRGDQTLFTGWEEVEYSWRFVDPLAQEWSQTLPPFPNYAAGSWGPEAAQQLLLRDGRQWAQLE